LFLGVGGGALYHYDSFNYKVALCPGSTGVENSTYNPKFKGSNPTTGTGREKIAKKEYWASQHKKVIFMKKLFVFRC
jgi:hypothetical protein